MAAEYTLERSGYDVEQVDFFEWWPLTGKKSALKRQLPPGVQTYCKLKGSREMTRRIHRKREAATMGLRDVYYTFMVDDIIWIKLKDEIIEIKGRIDDAIAQADGHYENRWFADAFPHYNQAKEFATKYLPNRVSYSDLERASQCQAHVAREK
jgi:hypothetical protein